MTYGWVCFPEQANCEAYYSKYQKWYGVQPCAYYEQPPTPTTYKLTVTSTEGGTTEPQPGVYSYDTGTVVSVYAISLPEPWRFDHWLLDGAPRSENPIEVTMNSDHSLHAVFTTEAPPPPAEPWIFTLMPIVLGSILEAIRQFGR